MIFHAVLLIYFIVLLLGLISLSSASVITIVTGDKILRYFIFFFTLYTLQILKNVIRYYLVLNLSSVFVRAALFFTFTEYILHAVMIYSIVLFIHFLISLPGARLINAIILMISILTFSFQMFLSGLRGGYGVIRFSGFYDIKYSDIIFLLLFLYAILIGLLRMKYIIDEQKKITLKKLLTVGIIFFPGVVYDIVSYNHKMMYITPLVYICITLLLTYYLIRYYLKNYSFSPGDAEENRDTLFEKYGITEREKDSLLLLLKGYSNRKIGETLYISLSTVKSHVYSIFKKTGVTSRYELIHFLKEMTSK